MESTEGSTAGLREIRLGAAELPGCVALVTEVRWNQTADDWRTMLALGEGYGLVAPDGTLVATSLALPYRERRLRLDQHGAGDRALAPQGPRHPPDGPRHGGARARWPRCDPRCDARRAHRVRPARFRGHLGHRAHAVPRCAGARIRTAHRGGVRDTRDDRRRLARRLRAGCGGVLRRSFRTARRAASAPARGRAGVGRRWTNQRIPARSRRPHRKTSSGPAWPTTRPARSRCWPPRCAG